MSDFKTVSIPPKTRERLAQLIKERDALNARIDDVVIAAQEMLQVPDGCQIRSLDEGFIVPVDVVSPPAE